MNKRIRILGAGAASLALMLTAGQAVSAAQADGGLTYVALGDSYAAGQGLGNYEDGTDVKKGRKRNVCHRSSGAFSQLPDAVLPDVTDRAFWACSGATSSDMQSIPSDQYNQPRQTDQVGTGTRWISLFAGGDDLDFGAIGISCVKIVSNHRIVIHVPGGVACSDALATARGKRPNAQNNLAQLYSTLLDRAPGSVLAIVGYPRILPDSYDGVPTLAGSKFCVLDHYPVFGVQDVGMPVSDAKDVDKFVTQLNATVQAAVDQVKNQLGGDAFRIKYVDTYDSSVPHNCKGTTPHATVAAAQLSLGRGQGGNFLKNFLSTATLHPTTAGQQLFASKVKDAFGAADPVITTTALPEAVVGQPYHTELTTADHRTGTWAIISGTLPHGLALDGFTISGTPDTTGQVTLGLRFTDSTGRTDSVDASLLVGAAPSIVIVSRPSGLAGFASYLPNVPCPAPSPGHKMWVYGEGAGYTAGEFDNFPVLLSPPTNSLLVRTSWTVPPGSYDVHIDCIEGSANSADGGTVVKRITFRQTVTGPASHVVITPDKVTPGGRMQISGGSGCGIDTDASSQHVSTFVWLPDSLAGAYLGDAGFTDANAGWGPVDYPVPTQAKTQIAVQATCSSNGDRGGAYFYLPSYVAVS
jgi:lysophospholipase L1-like esterase